MTTPIDLDSRFRYHPASTEERRNAHALIREACAALAANITALCPDGREAAVALTKTEEAMFWANAAIARQP